MRLNLDLKGRKATFSRHFPTHWTAFFCFFRQELLNILAVIMSEPSDQTPLQEVRPRVRLSGEVVISPPYPDRLFELQKLTKNLATSVY